MRGYVPRHFQGSLKEWQELGVLNYEMEGATLFTMTSSMGLRGAMIASVIASRTASEKPQDQVLEMAEERLALCIKELRSRIEDFN